MFAYIKGTLVSSKPASAVVDVNGIGYFLHISCRTLGELPHIGQSVHFFTTFVIREFSQSLYGFLCNSERDVFEILLNVTGIGPKLALSLIGHLSIADLQAAVGLQDLPTLCRVPGVGKKTAERLIVELKDKLPNFPQMGPSQLTISLPDAQTRQIQDAMLALINLGYTQSAAQKAIKLSMQDFPDTVDLALLITKALQKIKN